MGSRTAGVFEGSSQGALVTGHVPVHPGCDAAQPPGQRQTSVVTEALEDRLALVGDLSNVAGQEIRIDDEVLHDARAGQGSLVAGRLGPLERLRDPGLRVIEPSARVQHASKVRQDRKPGRIIRLQQRRAAAVQVHRRGDVGPLERPPAGRDQTLGSPARKLSRAVVDRRQLLAVVERLLQVISDHFPDLAPAVACRRVEPAGERFVELGAL